MEKNPNIDRMHTCWWVTTTEHSNLMNKLFNTSANRKKSEQVCLSEREEDMG